MARLMRDAPGIGLAATQVGVMKRLLVYELDDGLVSLCNPEIVERSDTTELDEEGCLSLPGISLPIPRNTSVVCEAQDLDGEPVTIRADGLLARLLQHELDHLDGILILDRASEKDRKEALKRYREILLTG